MNKILTDSEEGPKAAQDMAEGQPAGSTPGSTA